MKAKRVFRPSRKTAAERAQERELRERLQKERPTLDDLIQSGECDPDAVMTMGMYFDLQEALQALKRDREKAGLSVNEIAQRSGLDRAVVSRLEHGKQENPTVATLMRYAAAIGKRFSWNYEDLSSEAAFARETKAARPRSASGQSRRTIR